MSDFNDDATRLAIELRLRLSGLTFPVGESAAHELRDKVGQYAEALVALGMTAEGAVTAVRAVLSEAGFDSQPRAASIGAINPEDRLVLDVVRWCMDGAQGQREN
jgi:hypothetical protein